MANSTDNEVAEIARLTMLAPHLANVRPTTTQDGIAKAIRRVRGPAAELGLGAGVQTHRGRVKALGR